MGGKGIPIHADLNSASMNRLAIPDSDRVRLFFWQVYRFVNKLQLPEGYKALPNTERSCLTNGTFTL